MKKRKIDTDYNINVASSYKLISDKFQYSARVSSIWELLLCAFGMDEFLLLDNTKVINGNFESYLIDEIQKFNSGGEVDFNEIKNAIYTAGTFSKSEKILFESGDIESVLWAIFLLLSSGPNLNIELKDNY